MEYVDAFTLLPKTQIKCLDDGFVRLVDCMPRMALKDRNNIEYAIVECARISYGMSIKTPQLDANLVRYLYKNAHTSPFEAVKFKFHIRCPLFVRTHLIRHRTANLNEYSLRYAEIKDSNFYRPSQMTEEDVPGGGIRIQSKVNKQGSTDINDEQTKENIKNKFIEIETQLEKVYDLYSDLIKMGVAREVARFCLPNAQYTELYYTMDLNNFLKFITLRADVDHAQPETVVYARAMLELVKPLIPTVLEIFNNTTIEGMKLSKDEVDAIKNKQNDISTTSESQKREYKNKIDKLSLQF